MSLPVSKSGGHSDSQDPFKLSSCASITSGSISFYTEKNWDKFTIVHSKNLQQLAAIVKDGTRMGRLPFWSSAQQRHPHLVAQGNYRESQSSAVLCQEQEVPTAVGASECAVLAVSTATAPESQPDTQGCLHPCPCQAPRDRNCSSSTSGNRSLVKAILSAAATGAPSGSNNQTQDQV